MRLGPGAAAAIRSSRPLTSMCSGACREERRGKLCLHCGGEEGAVAYLHHTVPMNHTPATLPNPLHTPGPDQKGRTCNTLRSPAASKAGPLIPLPCAGSTMRRATQPGSSTSTSSAPNSRRRSFFAGPRPLIRRRCAGQSVAALICNRLCSSDSPEGGERAGSTVEVAEHGRSEGVEGAAAHMTFLFVDGGPWDSRGSVFQAF